MSEIKKYLEKAGGKELLKQYLRTGVLLPAMVQFCLLGRSKKALELLRMTVSLKIQQRLKRKYFSELTNYRYDDTLKHESSCRLWIFWWQGMENAPAIVRKCYQSVVDNLKEWDITIITEQNYQDYVSFPNHILGRFKKGHITLTHFSDLLRLELLIEHGGLWLDATVLCTSGDIPKSILNSDLFVYQAQKPGADGRATVMSSWCMYAKTNSKILMATRMLLYKYWEKNTKMDDYFLLHQFFTIVCDFYQDEAKNIPPFCNSVPHILLLHLFNEFDSGYWNEIKRMSCFHKLSYKLDNSRKKLDGTYYSVLIEQ